MNTVPLSTMDVVGPVIAAALFILVMSQVREPHRRAFNAILAAGAAGLYISGGFGPWELLYAAVATPVAYRGLSSYRFIALAWWMHATWDLPHHLLDKPLWPYAPTSSFGCVIFDTLIGIWFFVGAPAVPSLTYYQSLRRIAAGRLSGSK
jgi:hypothetical protein